MPDSTGTGCECEPSGGTETETAARTEGTVAGKKVLVTVTPEYLSAVVVRWERNS
jgi:hypothetical protein